MFIQIMWGGIMASPYSLDLREKILEAHQRGLGSQRYIAECFGVSLGFVEKLLRQVRRSGEVAAHRQGGGPASRVTDDVLAHIEQLVQGQPDITRAELAERLAQDGIIKISVTTVGRALDRLGFTRKKKPYTPVNATRPRYVRHVKTTGHRLADSIPGT